MGPSRHRHEAGPTPLGRGEMMWEIDLCTLSVCARDEEEKRGEEALVSSAFRQNCL